MKKIFQIEYHIKNAFTFFLEIRKNKEHWNFFFLIRTLLFYFIYPLILSQKKKKTVRCNSLPQWINVLIVQCSIINHVVYLFHEGKTRMFQIHLKSFHERTKSDTKKWISITFTLPKWKKGYVPMSCFSQRKTFKL